MTMKNKLIVFVLMFSIILISGMSSCEEKNILEKNNSNDNLSTTNVTADISIYSSEITGDHYLGKPATLDSLDAQRKFWHHECNETNGNVIEFYYKPATIPRVVGGDWMTKSIVDCGSYYWVQEFYDWGPQYFGPFDK